MPATALLWSILLVVVAIAVVIYVIITVQRARRTQRARSEERAAALLLALHQGTAPPAPAVPTPAVLTPAVPAPAVSTPTVPTSRIAATAARTPTAAATAPAQPGPLVRRPHLLTDRQRMLYLVLRSAMPDHTIMANVRIVDLVDGSAEPEAIERDPRLRELLHERADFIICTAELVPIAALVIYAAGIPAVPDERIKVAALRELGMKFLRFRADGLPRPAAVRGLILG